MPENRDFVVINDPNTCYWCEERVADDEDTCTSCGFPQRADEWTQRQWLGAARKKKKDDANNLKWTRNMLFGVAAYYAVSGFITYLRSDDISDMYSWTVIAAVYAALGLWALKKPPFVPLVTGFSLFILLNLVLTIAMPVSILRGIIIKIVIAVYFIRTIMFARNMRPEKHDFDNDDVLHN